MTAKDSLRSSALKKKLIISLAGIIALAMAIGVFLMPNFSPGGGIKITREVFLEGDAALKAETIAQATDGDLIFLGSRDGQASAVRTDAQGTVKWRYMKAPTETDPSLDINFSSMPPVYESAAVMSDNSVFLCGAMTGTKKGTALLTHLDSNGKLLGEQLFHPSPNNTNDLGGTFLSCKAWNNGLILVGLTALVQPNDHPSPWEQSPFIEHDFYWILYVDTRGQVKWEKRVPVTNRILGSPSLSNIQFLSDGSLAFSASRGDNITEIVHLLPNGDTNTRVLEGNYVLVTSTHKEPDLELLLLSRPFGRVTLNSDLQEVERVAGNSDLVPMHLTAAYRMADKSMVLFGAMYDSMLRREDHPGGRKFDPTLQHREDLRLPKSSGSYWVDSASPLAKDGEFVTTRLMFKGPVEDRRSGLNVYFITVH